MKVGVNTLSNSRGRWILSLCALFFLSLPLAQGQTKLVRERGEKVFNWGARLGMNALSTLYLDIENNGGEVPSRSYTNKTGFVSSAFMRINIDKFFMQPELVWNIYNHHYQFDYTDLDVVHNYDMNVRSYAVGSAVLFGYKIVKNDPFTFSLIAGPTFKQIYQAYFDIDTFEPFYGKSPNYSIGVNLGFAINIDKVYFDIRYEFVTPDSNVNFGDINEMPDELRGIKFLKNENVLSFSCGMMF